MKALERCLASEAALQGGNPSAPLIIRRSQQISGADTSDYCAYRERDQICGDKPKIGAIHIHTPEGATEMSQRKELRKDSDTTG